MNVCIVHAAGAVFHLTFDQITAPYAVSFSAKAGSKRSFILVGNFVYCSRPILIRNNLFTDLCTFSAGRQLCAAHFFPILNLAVIPVKQLQLYWRTVFRKGLYRNHSVHLLDILCGVDFKHCT